MSAIAMKSALTKLAARHGTPAPAPNIIPLSEPTASAEMILEGIACSAGEPNLDRSAFAKHALTWPSNCAEIPLYMRHDESRRVGTIKNLAYAPNGDLKVSCVVTDPRAMRMGGFSIGASATEWTIHNESRSDYWAEITRAVLCELSITDRPADPRALVLRRFKPATFDIYLDKLNSYENSVLKHCDLEAAAFEKMREIVEAMMSIDIEAPPRPMVTLASATPHIYGKLPARPRPKSEFGQLAEQLSERGEA